VVLIKGKIIVLFSEDFKNLPSMDRDFQDREVRFQSLKSDSRDEDLDGNSIFSIYGKNRVSKLRRAIEGLTKSPLQFIITSDNINLAYRQYDPYVSKANLIIVTWNNNHYDLIAHRLSKSYEVTCFVFDVRGLGYSGGKFSSKFSYEFKLTF
jgi:hypothetical protein